mmetsp:Transcript_129852/g.289709  ORF Transcript_129852/g.289709 Transcript_129852/m.289709 type:complete len:349 (-) Transcript_129852:32-1078(-)
MRAMCPPGSLPGVWLEDGVSDRDAPGGTYQAQVRELYGQQGKTQVDEDKEGCEVRYVQAEFRGPISEVPRERGIAELHVRLFVQHGAQMSADEAKDVVTHNEDRRGGLSSAPPLGMHHSQLLHSANGNELCTLVEVGRRRDRKVLRPKALARSVLVIFPAPVSPIQLHCLARMLPEQPSDVALRGAQNAAQVPARALIDHACLHDGDELAVSVALQIPTGCQPVVGDLVLSLDLVQLPLGEAEKELIGGAMLGDALEELEPLLRTVLAEKLPLVEAHDEQGLLRCGTLCLHSEGRGGKPTATRGLLPEGRPEDVSRGRWHYQQRPAAPSHCGHRGTAAATARSEAGLA